MKSFLVLAACAVVISAPIDASARFDDRNAIHSCKQAARAKYSARGFSHMTAANRGHGYFKVMGTIRRRGQPNAILRCRVRRGRITELSIKGASKSGAAIGAAIGIAAGAIIVGSALARLAIGHWRLPTCRPGRSTLLRARIDRRCSRSRSTP